MRNFERDDLIVPREHVRDWVKWALVVHEVGGDGSIDAYPMGGGFQYHFDVMDVEKYDFIKVPKKLIENPSWRSTSFFAEWLEKSYKGWTNDQKWNGWAMPYFELEEGLRYAKDSGSTIYDHAEDAFVTTREDFDDEKEVDRATVIIVKGRGPLIVYPIGAGSWIWYETPPKEEGEGEEELGRRKRKRRK